MIKKLFATAMILFLCSCSLVTKKQSDPLLEKYRTTHREAYMYQAPPPNSESFLAGASKIEITPPSSLGTAYLAGYNPNKPAHGVHDPLWARCTALTDPKGARVVFVSLNLIGYSHDDIEGVRKEIATFSDATVMIASTHTHSGPDTLGIWGPGIWRIPLMSGRNEDYMRFLKHQIVACVGDALEDQRSAHLYVSQKEIPALNRNFRESDVVDRTVTVLYARERFTDETIFFLLNFGAHPEIMRSDLLSADFVGAWYEAEEKDFGGMAMFFNGALGALVAPESPNIYTTHELPDMGDAPQYRHKNFGVHIKDAWGNARWFAERLERRVARTVEFEEIEPTNIIAEYKTIYVSLTNPSFIWAWRLGLLKRPDYQGGLLTTEVGVVRIGPLAVAFLPGETPPKLSFRARKILEQAGHYTMVVSLANDELGYLLDEEQFASGLYAYEQTMCVNPRIADVLAIDLWLMVFNQNIHALQESLDRTFPAP